MIKLTRVRARNVRRGDYMVKQLSVRVPQTANLLKTDATHIWINGLKFDPNETVKVERIYNGKKA